MTSTARSWVFWSTSSMVTSSVKNTGMLLVACQTSIINDFISFILKNESRFCSTFALRGLFWGFELQRFTEGTRPAYTDRLNMHYIVCICLQIPQCTAPCGSVHFLDKAQHANIFSLLWMDKTIFNRKSSLHFSLKPDDFKWTYTCYIYIYRECWVCDLSLSMFRLPVVWWQIQWLDPRLGCPMSPQQSCPSDL